MFQVLVLILQKPLCRRSSCAQYITYDIGFFLIYNIKLPELFQLNLIIFQFNNSLLWDIFFFYRILNLFYIDNKSSNNNFQQSYKKKASKSSSADIVKCFVFPGQNIIPHYPWINIFLGNRFKYRFFFLFTLNWL